MKKALAILLIGVHLLNLVGCYGLFARWGNILEKDLSTRLDRDEYVGSDAITFRLPVSLPYPKDEANYERVEGKFTYEGEVYQLVKQKIFNDTLYLVCVKDLRSTELKSTLEDYTSALADHASDPASKSKVASLTLKEFETVGQLSVSRASYLINPLSLPGYSFAEKLNTHFPLDQPPRI